MNWAFGVDMASKSGVTAKHELTFTGAPYMRKGGPKIKAGGVGASLEETLQNMGLASPRRGDFHERSPGSPAVSPARGRCAHRLAPPLRRCPKTRLPTLAFWHSKPSLRRSVSQFSGCSSSPRKSTFPGTRPSSSPLPMTPAPGWRHQARASGSSLGTPSARFVAPPALLPQACP